MFKKLFTQDPWKLWRGPEFVGGGEDICIGAGEKWLANMDHRASLCPDVSLEYHDYNDDCLICSMEGPKISEEQLANAQLMVTAPKLLEACEDAWATFSSYPDDTIDMRMKLLAVIKEATTLPEVKE